MPSLSIGELIWGNLLFAAVTLFGLFLVMGLGAIVRRPRELNYFIEVGLTVAGPICLMYFLLWLATNIPWMQILGILVCLVGVGLFVFLRDREKGVSTGRRSLMVELSFSLGLSAVAWAFVRGARALTAAVGHSLDFATPQNSVIARVLALLVTVGVSIALFKLLQKDERRRMQQPRYRALEEEKWELEKRIAAIVDMQEYWEWHSYVRSLNRKDAAGDSAKAKAQARSKVGGVPVPPKAGKT